MSDQYLNCLSCQNCWKKNVLIQSQPFLDENNILEKFQSGFRPRHSTESALLKVFNDMLLSVDAGDSIILVLLDLTAAFDTVDHQIFFHVWLSVQKFREQS